MFSGLARPARTVLLAIALALAACGDDDASPSTDESPTDKSPNDESPADAGGSPADDYVGPGDSDSDSDSDEALGENELAIQDFEFLLQPVSAGADVSFGNLDGAPHTLTAEGGEFDTGQVGGGDSATFTAPAAGDYSVFCVIHPDITGTLTVE